MGRGRQKVHLTLHVVSPPEWKRKAESAPNATRSVSTSLHQNESALKMNGGVKHFDVPQRLQFIVYTVLFTC